MMTIFRSFMTALVVMISISAAAQNPRSGEFSLGNSPLNHSQEWVETADADTSLDGATVIPGTILDYHTIKVSLQSQDDADVFRLTCPEGPRRQFRIWEETPKSGGYYNPAQLWVVAEDGAELPSYSEGHNGDGRPILYFSCNPGENFYIGHGPLVTYYLENSRRFSSAPLYTQTLGIYELRIDSRVNPRYERLPQENQYCSYEGMPEYSAADTDAFEVFYKNPVSGQEEHDGDIFGNVLKLDLKGIEDITQFVISSAAMLPLTTAVVSLDGKFIQGDYLDPAEPFINLIAPGFRNKSFGGTISWPFGWEDRPDEVYLFMGAFSLDPADYRLGSDGQVCVTRRNEFQGFSAINSMFVELVYPRVELRDLGVTADADSIYVSFNRVYSRQNNGLKARLRKGGLVIPGSDSLYQSEPYWVTPEGSDSTYSFALSREGISGEIEVEVLSHLRQTYNDDFQPALMYSILLPPGTAIEYGPNESGFEVRNLWPNPANTGLVYVELSSPTFGQASVEILDALGRMVSRGYVTVVPGSNEHTLDTSSYPAGVYIVLVTPESGEALTRRLTVVR